MCDPASARAPLRMRAVVWALTLAAVVVPLRAAGAAEAAIAIQNSAFLPKEVVVNAGDTVVWTNRDALAHSVTADDGSFDSHPDCGTPDGTCLSQGQTYKATVSNPGRYQYHCRIHGAPGGAGMAGTVTVVGASRVARHADRRTLFPPPPGEVAARTAGDPMTIGSATAS